MVQFVLINYKIFYIMIKNQNKYQIFSLYLIVHNIYFIALFLIIVKYLIKILLHIDEWN